MGRRRPPGLVQWAALMLLAGTVAATELDGHLAAGDEAWSRRAAGRSGLTASPAPIAAAVAAYERAVDIAPGSIAAREKLLRALYYLGRFASDDDGRAEAYRHARDLAEEGLARLGAAASGKGGIDLRQPEQTVTALSDRPEAAALFFWAAAHWGLWGEHSGALAAARRGVATRVRDRALVAIGLDPGFEAGGGLRILGRLHSEAPRIPLVTGWVDRAVAVASLERAVELGPAEPLNRVYLADALLRFRPERREEAVDLLRSVVAQPPRSDRLLEDEETLGEARRLLREVAPES